ncbi:hypothetical protein F5148DRAFT_1374789 [Russula earlei]|uniref:Uncharacterized protein n=1 Tax=Russula earlei TaxID=71964 RepID=A0ACC0UEE6_9AGAM|nr:hypothetical protein F5148DRAFT_1374789 [Russula earlei]
MALAHLKSCALITVGIPSKYKYVVIRKSIIFVINKIGVTHLEDLAPDKQSLVQEVIDTEGFQRVQVSCYLSWTPTLSKASDALLVQRVDANLTRNQIDAITNCIHWCCVMILSSVYPRNRQSTTRTTPIVGNLRYIELEEGGAGLYNVNLKSAYNAFTAPARILPDSSIPTLEALEREEEMLKTEGYYDEHEDMFDREDEREAAAKETQAGGTEQIENDEQGAPSTHQRAVVIAKMRGAGRKRKRDEAEDGTDVDGVDARAPRSNRQLAGLRDEAPASCTRAQQASRAALLPNLGLRGRNMLAKAGEGDRAIRVKIDAKSTTDRCHYHFGRPRWPLVFRTHCDFSFPSSTSFHGTCTMQHSALDFITRAPEY